MPVYEYKCEAGHLTVKIERITRPLDESVLCVECKKKQTRSGPGARAKLVPSVTGKPILKAGGAGGFYSPTR